MGSSLAGTGNKAAMSCCDLAGRIRARALYLGQGSLNPHDLLLSGLAGVLDEAIRRDTSRSVPSPAVEVLLDLLKQRNRDAQLSRDLDGLSHRLHHLSVAGKFQSAS